MSSKTLAGFAVFIVASIAIPAYAGSHGGEGGTAEVKSQDQVASRSYVRITQRIASAAVRRSNSADKRLDTVEPRVSSTETLLNAQQRSLDALRTAPNAGPKGDRGEAGPAGPAGPQGPAGFRSVTTEVAVANLVPAGETVTITATCLAGYQPIGGGFNNSSNGPLLSSYPIANGWVIRTINASQDAAIPMSAYAICVPQ